MKHWDAVQKRDGWHDFQLEEGRVMIILLSRYITSELLWTRYDGARIKIRKNLTSVLPTQP